MADTMNFSFHDVDEDEDFEPPAKRANAPHVSRGTGQVIYDWPVEDLKELCRRIRESSMKLPRCATIAYNKAESRMDWEEVAFGGKTGEDCRVKWQQLSNNVRNFRNIAEMLLDAERWLESKPRKAKLALTDHPDKPTKPPSIFLRYMMEEMPKMKAKFPGVHHRQIVAKIGEMYKKIPPSTVTRLKADWQREHDEYQERLAKFYAVHPEAAPYVRSSSAALAKNRSSIGTAFMQYVEDKSRDPKCANLTKDELRAKWEKLKDEKKIVYIEAALDLNRKKEGQSSTLAPKEKCDVLTKDERDLYDRFLGKPARPPTSGFALFKSIASVELKDLPAAERNKEFQARWSMMSRAEQNKFHNEVKLMKQTFDKDMAEYLEKLKQREQLLIQNGPGIKVKMPLTNGQNSFSPTKKMRTPAAGCDFPDTIAPLNLYHPPSRHGSPTKSQSAFAFSTKEEDLGSDLEVCDVYDGLDTKPKVRKPKDVAKNKLGTAHSRGSSPTKAQAKITALSCYQEHELDKWREINPDLPDRELLKSIAEAFEELSDKKKAKWERKAEKRREQMAAGEK